MKKKLVIALFLKFELYAHRQYIRGIAARAHKLGNVDLQAAQPGFFNPETFKKQHLDGIIWNSSFPHQPSMKKVIQRHREACVDLDTTRRSHGPQVRNDDRAVGNLAAEHLRERGFRRFAFMGIQGLEFSRLREEGFLTGLEQHGLACAAAQDVVYSKRKYWQPTLPQKELVRWLRRLPERTGLFLASDFLSEWVLDCAHETGIKIPDRLAAVSVDNNEGLCLLTHPTLSSIPIDFERIGAEALHLVVQLARKKVPPRSSVLVPPLPVVVRQSSDIFAVEDPEVSQAWRFIYRRSNRPLAVGDVLRAVPTGRRSLEMRFKNLTGRTLLQEIRRQHVERARELLRGTDWPTPVVAQEAGFADAKQLSLVFRQITGQTPISYRNIWR